MKRSTFIKRLVLGAVAVPAVAAKAIASRKKEGLLLDLYPGATYAYSLRPLYSNGKAIPLDEHGNAYAGIMYDQSGNRSSKSLGKMNMNKLRDEIEWVKPEDTPLYKPHTAT